MDERDDDLVELDDPLAPPPVGRESAAQAALFFRDGLDLPLPPLPWSMVDAMRVLGAGHVGTRADAPPLDDLAGRLAELERGQVTDYVQMGMAGHGMVSGTVCYQLLLGRLAVFLELRLNALDAGWPVMRERIVQAFQQAEALIGAADRLPPEGLIVVQSDVGESRIGHFRPGGGIDLEPEPLPLHAAWRRMRRG